MLRVASGGYYKVYVAEMEGARLETMILNYDTSDGLEFWERKECENLQIG